MDCTEILELLLKQRDIQQEMLDLSYLKRQVIVKGTVDELSEIVTKERRLIARLKQLEKKRTPLLAELATQLGVSDATLGVMIENSQGELKEQLLTLQKDLLGLIQSQVDINKLNQELLESQIEFTETQLNLYVGAEDPINNLYGGDGRSGDEMRRTAGFLDKQV